MVNKMNIVEEISNLRTEKEHICVCVCVCVCDRKSLLPQEASTLIPSHQLQASHNKVYHGLGEK
jgi:hypothetical protein